MAEVRVTKAQRELILWLYNRGRTEDIRGGDLVDYYYERWLRDNGLSHDMPGYRYPDTPRSHGYRRAGGTVLARMAEQGLLKRTIFNWGTQLYDFTPAAYAAITPD